MYTNHLKKDWYNRDSRAKAICRCWDSNHDLPTQVFFLCSCSFLTGFGHFHGSSFHMVEPLFKWPVLWRTTFQWSPASSLEHSLDFLPWKRFAAHLRGWHAPTTEPGFVFFCSTNSSQEVTLPSTILAQCCVTSVILWELGFPTWHRPLTTKNTLTTISVPGKPRFEPKPLWRNAGAQPLASPRRLWKGGGVEEHWYPTALVRVLVSKSFSWCF